MSIVQCQCPTGVSVRRTQFFKMAVPDEGIHLTPRAENFPRKRIKILMSRFSYAPQFNCNDKTTQPFVGTYENGPGPLRQPQCT